jgi:hypothetical protein
MVILTEDIRWRRITSIVLVWTFVAAILFPLCAASEPLLVLNPIAHEVTPVGRTGTFSSEVVIDNIHISGKTAPDAKISVKKTIFGTVTESSVQVSSNGSFSISVQFEVGPGFAQQVERGDVKLSVVVSQGSMLKTLDVPLNQPASGAAPNVGAELSAGAPGYPHTFVAYNNPYYFQIGYYVDDEGNSIQTTKDAVATQLAKFSAVSLHYTDEASNIALIKQKNPNVKVFAYINPEFCYKSNDSNSEYQLVVKYHPEWFLYPTEPDRQQQTNPIVEYNGTEQVMDLTTGWQAEIVNLSTAALAKGFDGLYVDCVCDDPSLCYGYGASTAPAGDWHTALDAYLDQVHVAGKQNFYNGQSPVVVSTNQDFLDRTDGWMDEGFISYKGWEVSTIDMPQYASELNKFTMFYAVNSSADVQHFYFASALLSDGYFFYAPASTQWFGEYGTYCGDPTGQAYQIQGLPGVWARDYTAAKVVVNPTSAAITVDMPGYIDSSGNSASHLTIDSNDAAILKSAGGWSAWTNKGGQLLNGSGPAIYSWGTERTGWFVTGTNNALYHMWNDSTGAHGWENLGGVLTSSPAAVSRSAGKIDVFVRGGDGALWSRWTVDGGTSWSAWYKIGGQLLNGTSPAAYDWGEAGIGVFVTGTNRALYQVSYEGNGNSAWSNWENLGGVVTSSPGATASDNGVIDVFVSGNDTALWQREYSNSAWGSWTSLGGRIPSGTGPAACSWGPARLDVFVQGMDNALYHRWLSGGWSSWEYLGGKLTSSPGAAAASGGNRIDVFVRGGDGALWQKSYL